MATFRTDPETGRTVISQDNIVSSGSTNPGRPGGESGERGDPILSQQEFMNVTGRTATNPYGKQGFFSRVFGIDPSKISYSNNIPGGNQGIAQLNALAYDRYMNPAARVNVFGDEVGGDPTTGQLRYGVQPGDLTRFGTAVPGRREGIAGILDNLPFGIGMASRMFGSTPARVPGFDVREVVPRLGLGGPQPGEGVDPARLGNSLADDGLGLDAVDYDTMAYYDSSYGVDRPVDRFVDPDAVNARAEQNRATEDPYAFEDRRAQRQAAARPAQTVAEILMEEPPYTGPFTSQIAEDIFMSGADTPIGSAPQGIGTGSTGGATLQRDAAPFEESMREIERGGARSDLLMDMIEQLRRDNPLTDVAPPVPQSGGQIDLVGMLPPRPMMTPTPRPSRGIDPRAASLALELERLARERAMQ